MFAQSILKEGFEGTTFPPAGWHLVTEVGYGWERSTSSTTPIPGFTSGIVPVNSGQGVAMCNWGDAGVRQGLVTKQITPTATTDSLVYWLQQLQSVNDTMIVCVSTTTNTSSAAFYTHKLKIHGSATNSACIGAFVRYAVSLKDFVGIPIYIGFFNDDKVHANEVAWFLDDVSVGPLPQYDLVPDEKLIFNIGQVNQQMLLATYVENHGSTAVTSAEIGYQIGTQTPVITTATFTALTAATAAAPGGYALAASTSYYTPTSVGTFPFKYWVSKPNGHADDTIKGVIYVASQSVHKTPLYEGFSSSTCSPCATYNNTIFNPFIATASDSMNFIKYQQNWPSAGDPYYIADAGIRRDYYGVSALPTMFGQGSEVYQYTTTASSISHLQKVIGFANMEVGAFTISATPTYSGKTMKIPLTINPYITRPNLTLQVAVCEKLTTGNKGSNGETSFHHVMMAMSPDANGTAVDFTNGTPYTKTFNVDLTSSHVEEMSDLIVVAFIQDNVTKEILQSYSNDVTISGIEDHDALSNVVLYPNPTTGIVNIKNVTNAQINVLDILGQVVLSERGNSVDMSNLHNGTYFIQVIENEKVSMKKVILSK